MSHIRRHSSIIVVSILSLMGLLTQVVTISSCFSVQSSLKGRLKVMENPEEILHCLEEFSKSKPKDIPRELEEYLSFVAKTGDPIYQWASIKSLFREKLINVITDFYETCPSVDIPPCPNVEMFNYDVMKSFILEKLDAFVAAPFTLQRISELLTAPRKEYNRIDKYMRALEKNFLVVSTIEPGGRRNTENGEGIVNGLESEHLPGTSNSSNDINVEEMDDTPTWPRILQNESTSFQNNDNSNNENTPEQSVVQETTVTASKLTEAACSSSQETVITCRNSEEPYVSIEPVPSNTCTRQDNNVEESDVSVTITAIPAGVQKRRNSIEPVVPAEEAEQTAESSNVEASEKAVEDTQKESESIPEDETSSATAEIKPADSSSSSEDESPTKVDPYPHNLESNVTESDSSSAEESQDVTPSEITENVENVEKVEEAPENNECTNQESVAIDTIKCSSLPSEEQPSGDSDPTITSSEESSEKSVNVESSQTTEQIEEKSNDTLDSTEVKVEESHMNVDTDKQENISNEEPTPMEVDDVNVSETEQSGEVVKAETSSESS